MTLPKKNTQYFEPLKDYFIEEYDLDNYTLQDILFIEIMSSEKNCDFGTSENNKNTNVSAEGLRYYPASAFFQQRKSMA